MIFWHPGHFSLSFYKQLVLKMTNKIRNWFAYQIQGNLHANSTLITTYDKISIQIIFSREIRSIQVRKHETPSIIHENNKLKTLNGHSKI